MTWILGLLVGYLIIKVGDHFAERYYERWRHA